MDGRASSAAPVITPREKLYSSSSNSASQPPSKSHSTSSSKSIALSWRSIRELAWPLSMDHAILIILPQDGRSMFSALSIRSLNISMKLDRSTSHGSRSLDWNIWKTSATDLSNGSTRNWCSASSRVESSISLSRNLLVSRLDCPSRRRSTTSSLICSPKITGPSPWFLFPIGLGVLPRPPALPSVPRLSPIPLRFAP